MEIHHLKIILFAYSQGTGITYHMTHFAIEMNKIAHDFTVIHNGQEQNPGLFSKLKDANVSLLHINDFQTKTPKIYPNTVFHCQGFNQVKIIEKIANESNAKIVITLNAYRNGKWYKNIFVKYLIKRFKQIDLWCFSTYYSFLDFKTNGFQGNFTIIPLGLEETTSIKPVKEYVDILSDSIEKYSDKNKYIFYGAQFHKHKQHKELLETLAPILKEDSLLVIILCGSGKLLSQTENVAKVLGIRSQVKFLGRVDRNIFLSHLLNAKVAIVASKTETFGHNILEPLLLGKPVISLPVGIAPEIIKDYENGALCQLNSYKFSQSIKYFCGQKNISINTNYLIQQFSWEKIVSRYHLAYNSLYENSN